MRGLLKMAMALVPAFPSSEDVEHLRDRNDFWRLSGATDIEPRNHNAADQELGSDDRWKAEKVLKSS